MDKMKSPFWICFRSILTLTEHHPGWEKLASSYFSNHSFFKGCPLQEERINWESERQRRDGTHQEQMAGSKAFPKRERGQHVLAFLTEISASLQQLLSHSLSSVSASTCLSVSPSHVISSLLPCKQPDPGSFTCYVDS